MNFVTRNIAKHYGRERETLQVSLPIHVMKYSTPHQADGLVGALDNLIEAADRLQAALARVGGRRP